MMISMPSFETIPPPPDNATSPSEELVTNDFLLISTVPTVVNGMSDNARNLESVERYIAELSEESAILKESVRKGNMVLRDQLKIIDEFKNSLIEAKEKEHLLEGQAKELRNELQSVKEQHEKEKAKEHLVEEQAEELRNELLNVKEQHEKEKEELQMKIQQMEAVQKDGLQSDQYKLQIQQLHDVLKQVTAEKEQLIESLQKTHVKIQETEQSNLTSIAVELTAVKKELSVLREENRDLMALNNELLNQLSLQIPESVSMVGRPNESCVFNDEESGYAIVLESGKGNADFSPGPSLKGAIEKQCELQTSIACKNEELEEEKVKVVSLNSILEEKEKIIQELKQKNEQIMAEVEATSKLKKTELEDLANKLCIASVLTEEYKERCDRLEQDLENIKKTLDESKAAHSSAIAGFALEKKRLDLALKEEENAHEVVKRALAQSETNLKSLTEKHEEVLKLLADEEEKQKVKIEQANTLRYIENREHSVELGDMMAELVNVKQMLEAEQGKNRNLEEELSRLNREAGENEPSEIFRVQADVYKSDFALEKDAHQKTLADLERVTNEKLRLEEELDERGERSHPRAGRRSGSHRFFLVRPIDRRTRRTSTRSVDEAEEAVAESQPPTVECPKCGMTFTDLNAVQNHVEACFEDGAYP